MKEKVKEKERKMPAELTISMKRNKLFSSKHKHY